MNRHSRRAAEKKQQRQPDVAPTVSQTGSREMLSIGTNTPPIMLDVDPDLYASPFGTDAPTPTPHQTPRPGLLMRMFGKILLSSWILKRVEHPEVERLLASFATQVGRPDVVDELTRRKLLRGSF